MQIAMMPTTPTRMAFLAQARSTFLLPRPPRTTALTQSKDNLRQAKRFPSQGSCGAYFDCGSGRCIAMLVFFISKNSEEDEFSTQFKVLGLMLGPISKSMVNLRL
jgi:hypothetical protein